MAKGYWIGRVDVRDEDAYRRYALNNPDILKKYGGRFVVRGGRFEAVEGEARPRNVVIEFDSYDAAMACYRSPEYQENLKIRQANAVTDLIVIEGFDAP